MSFAPGDLELRYSAPSATAGNSLPGSPGTSIGRYVSQTPVASGSMGNLFPVLTSAEANDSNTDYQCIFLYNRHPYLTLTAAKLWITAQTSGIADAAVTLDNMPPSRSSATLQQADVIADKNTAPTAVGTFSVPTTKGAGISLPDLQSGHVQAVWIRRTAIPGAGLTDDGVTIRVEGEPLQ